VIDGAHVHQRGKLTEVVLASGVVHPEPVVEQQDPLTPLTTDLGTDLADTHTGDVEARLEPEEIRDRVRKLLGDVPGL